MSWESGAYFAGNVGIGTTQPEMKLEVCGRIFIDQSVGDPSFYIRKGDANISNMYWGIGETGVGGNNRFVIFQDDNGSYPWVNEWLVIKPNGNVGIGTPENLNAKLTIEGDEGVLFEARDKDGNLVFQIGKF
jgi:hypothetical protein